MRFTGEAHIEASKAIERVELIIRDLKRHCVAFKSRGSCFEAKFETSLAYIKADDRDICVRVEADDLMVCEGTKMLITSHISRHIANMPKCLLWLKGGETPFAAIVSHVNREREA